MQTLLRRIYNRVSWHFVLASLAAKDDKESRQFLRDAGQISHLRSKLSLTHTPEDFYNFAEQYFGIIQHKHEILGFLDAVRAEEPKRICEIGTAASGNTFLFSHALPSVELLVAVDLFVRRSAQIKMLAPKRLTFEVINGSSYAPRTMKKLKTLTAEQKFDMIFIDGDHRYEGVQKDYTNALQLIRPGGIIGFHDIVPVKGTNPQSGAYAGGVPHLWQEIKGKHESREFVEDWEQEGFGIGMIRIDAPGS